MTPLNASGDSRPPLYRLHLEKWQADVISGVEAWRPTGWEEWGFGIHGEDPEYVLSILRKRMDTFIDECLAENSGSCLVPVDFDPFPSETGQ